MATFPENEISLIRIYSLSRSVRDDLRANLVAGPDVPSRIRGRNPRPLTENRKARSRQQARAAVRRLLFEFHRVHAPPADDPSGAVAIDEAYDALLNRQFEIAKDRIDRIATASIPALFSARSAVLAATARDDVPFTAVETEIIQGRPVQLEVPSVFPGYRGQKLSGSTVDVLVEVAELLTRRAERQFRIGVVQAAAAAGQHDHEEALERLTGVDAGAAQLPEAKRKFLALQKALAHISRGDQLFRVGQPDDKAQAAAHYRKARQVLENAGISPANPLRKEIVDYASQQEVKLANGVNALGYSRQFVPDRPFTFYVNQADTRIRLAGDARDRFVGYLEKAFEREDVEAELQFEKATAQDRVEQAVLNERAAQERLSKVDRNIERIEDSRLFLDIAAGVEVVGAIAQTVAAAQAAGAAGAKPGSKAGVVSSSSGIVGTAVNFLARRNELGHEKELAKIDRRIAELKQASAAIDRRVAERRLDFVSDQLERTKGRNLNKDLYYALARTFEDLTLEHLDVAIHSAFLAERRAAFELGTSDFPQFIQLEYLKTVESEDTPLHGVVAAPELLRADLTDLQERFEADKSVPVLFTEVVSLQDSFPLEFSAFQTTGVLEFATSLYEFDKFRPGTYNRRLLAVEVEILGLLPSIGFRGTLRHVGPFLVREKDTTLAAERLLPTDRELADALDDLATGKKAALGGVTWFNPGPEIKELSVMSLSEERQLLGKDPSSRGIFEGYGPTGLWRLELPRDSNPNMNLSNIVDVRVHFHIVTAERDEDVEEHVKKLTAAYEAELGAGEPLDRITVLSMRDASSAAFTALEAGPSELSISSRNFPGDTSAGAKALLIQAIGDDDRGVEGVALSVSRPDAPFGMDATTGSDGFTQDISQELLTLPPDERFPVEGVWTFALDDTTIFDQLTDLRLFFVHEAGSP